jgi:hypothetical protein
MDPTQQILNEIKELRLDVRQILASAAAMDVHRRALTHRVNRLERGVLWIVGIIMLAVTGEVIQLITI